MAMILALVTLMASGLGLWFIQSDNSDGPGPILIGMGLLVLIFGSSIFLMGIRIVPTVGRFTFVFFIPVAVITILGLAASGLSP